MTNINFKVDENVKAKAKELFEDLGLDLSTALNIFLRKSIATGGIPFEINKEPNIEAMKRYGVRVVESEEDLKKYLAQGKEDIKNGRVITEEELLLQLRERYGI